MFDFLTRQNIISDSTEDPAKVKDNAELHNDGMNRKVEQFLKMGDFNGKSLQHFSHELFSLIAREMEISQGVFFLGEKNDGIQVLKFLSGYAYQISSETEDMIMFGEGLPGQVAKDGKLMNLTDIPEGYMSIQSGLGKASPASLIIFPIVHEGNTLAVIELASFHKFTREDEKFFEAISTVIAEQILKNMTNS